MTVDTLHPVRVVQHGGLLPFVREWLTDRYAAPALADIDDPSGVVVVVVGGGAKVGATEMDALPNLGAIANFGVGYDNIDVVEATRRGIVVSNTPDVLTEAVADLAAFLVIDVLRGITAADRFVRSGAWGRGEKMPLTRDVRDAVVGVLGLGRIGTAAANRLEAFGAVIHYHSRNPKDVAWPYHATPTELAAASDVLLVLTPGGAGTEKIVDAAVLDALGPDGYLVNVARGSVLDENALIAALEEGRVAGAGLDVFANEPHVPEALLRRHDVVLLPHVGSATIQTREAMGRLVIDNVDLFLERRTLVTPVN